MNSIILYKNILSTPGVTLTASSFTTGYPAANVCDYKAYTRWKSTVGDDLLQFYIQVLFPAEEVLAAASGLPIETAGGGDLLSQSAGPAEDAPDCIAIFNHNLGSNAVTVKVQRQNSVSLAWEDLLEFTPETDGPIMRLFDQNNAIGYRVHFTRADDDTQIYAAQIFLGKKLEMPNRPSGPLSPVEESIISKSEISKSGYTLGSLIAHHPLLVNHMWKYITRAWYEEYFPEFWAYAKTLKPFFYAWDLDTRPDDVVFVRLDEGYVRRELLSMLHYNDELQLQMRSIGN